MGYFDSVDINNELSKYKGMAIKDIKSSNEGDEGITIVFENGDILTVAWSSSYGEATLNGNVI